MYSIHREFVAHYCRACNTGLRVYGLACPAPHPSCSVQWYGVYRDREIMSESDRAGDAPSIQSLLV